MRTTFHLLALAALLCIPPHTASSGVLGEVRAGVREAKLPVLRDRAQRLIQRIEKAQQRFHVALLDLDRLDIPQAALVLDHELCLVEDEGNRLSAAVTVRDSSVQGLVEVAMDDAERARARMESVEELASTAHSYMRLLREMRRARHEGDLDRVLALYKERRSNSLPEQWAQPVRRILAELDKLRVEVTAERQALLRPQ